MTYRYRTSGVCSTMIEIEMDGDVVRKVRFTNGCNGNTQGVAALVEGMTVEEVERRLTGIRCGMKHTSCPDQLAKAVRLAYEAQSR